MGLVPEAQVIWNQTDFGGERMRDGVHPAN